MTVGKKDDTVKTFYVTEKNEVTIICSACGHEKNTIISPGDLRKTQGKANCTCRCKCGAVFGCRIELRKTYRKKVRLAGTCRNLRNKSSVEILVEDVSLKGIGFTCMSQHALRVGDELEVNFQLDDPRRSQVSRTVTVRKINAREIGASFKPTAGADPGLGFYLLN